MKKLLTIIGFAVVIAVFGAVKLYPNNLQVENISMTGQNTSEDYVYIEFDISWKNGWRNSVNWDAAWIFIKYRETQSGIWQHAKLSANSAEHGKGSIGHSGIIKAVEDQKGVFFYRSGNGTGNFGSDNVTLRWNYGENAISDVIKDDVMNISVFAIEMCYVPEGSFYVGDSVSTSTFQQITSKAPVQISTTPIRLKTSGDGDSQLTGDGITIDGDGGIDWNNDGTIDNPDFPTGYKAFYCMKYEITQDQYVDYLNTLTRAAQDGRTESDINGKTAIQYYYVMSEKNYLYYRNAIRCDSLVDKDLPLTFYCDYNHNGIPNEDCDGGNIACNYISWADGCYYAKWAGLRPMSELEFEKACRGEEYPVHYEYAWGNNNLYPAKNLANGGCGNESIGSGNCHYTSSYISGPLRVGIFSEISGGLRENAGATYYGIMEMSGNLYERCIGLAYQTGREFTMTDWSFYEDASGSGLRGGNWSNNNYSCRVSYRLNAVTQHSYRFRYYGFRGVRPGD